MCPIDQRFDVIPAIDLIDGRCVRLLHGDYKKETVYSDDPVAMARRWQDAGATRLHVVDLDGARAGKPVNLETAGRIASSVDMVCDYGGGIRSLESARQILALGFEMFSIGTGAIDEDFAYAIFTEFGDSAIGDIAAKDGLVAVQGWQKNSEVAAADLARRLVWLGCRRIIFTDISRDGSLTGQNLVVTREIAEAAGVPVIASGGVSSISDVVAASKLHNGVEGVIIGRALYDGRVDLADAIAAAAK